MELGGTLYATMDSVVMRRKHSALHS
eukprot:COSAG02_NODE_62120_length_266_cov_2.047904_1_plen_25_part_10